MTERREAVARAIDDVINDGLDAWFGGRWESPDWTRVIDRAADAALAAMDAEPTEAAVDRGELSYQISAAILPTVLDFVQFDSDRDQEAFCDRLADKAAGMAITVFANHAARKARQ